MNLKCPHCPCDLQAIDTDRGPTTDFCAECGGIWFDPGEIEEFLGAGYPLPVPKGAKGGTLACPRCDGNLAPIVLDVAEPLELDICNKCSGLWFDRGEVAKLKTVISSRAPIKFTAVHGSTLPEPTGTPRKKKMDGPPVIPILDFSEAENEGLDWTWVFVGFAVMIVIMGVLGAGIQVWVGSAGLIESQDVSTDPRPLVVIGGALAFLCGGFLIGWRSEGFTLKEPSIAAIPAGMIFLALFKAHFSTPILAILLVGCVICALTGAVFGERV